MSEVSREEFEKLEDEATATSAEVHALKMWLDEKFSNLNTRVLLYVGVGVGLIRFDVPTPITAVALAAVIAKFALSIVAKL